CGEVGAVGDRLAHQPIERIGMEQCPPLRRQILPRRETLCAARGTGGGRGLRRQLGLGIAGSRLRIGLAEIRTHHAAGENRTCCAKEYCATHYFHLAVPVIDRYRFAVAERGTPPATSLFCPSIVRQLGTLIYLFKAGRFESGRAVVLVGPAGLEPATKGL